MPEIRSRLEGARLAYQPKLPAVLSLDPDDIGLARGGPTESVADHAAVRAMFPATYGKPEVRFEAGRGALVRAPLAVGVVLSGGQAPGGHNVISGLADALARLDPKSRVLGFLGGPSGLVDDRATEISPGLVDRYRNTGGFDMIGSGRTKLESQPQFDACAKNLRARGIGALVVIGGDDSNTNAAVLAEYFATTRLGIQVVGAPKTIDGDLKNHEVEASFGFDTATKTYAELIGNIQRDCLSAKKYWHFVKLMGRAASHIALECALACRPNVALISEEIAARGRTLGDLADELARVVAARAAAGMNYGVALVPEGLVEFVPEMKVLIGELNDLLAREASRFDALSSDDERAGFVSARLGEAAGATFRSLPRGIQAQLLAERDPHGNVQVSRIETEKLLIEMAGERLAAWKREGKTKAKFSPIGHFFGYEGRCAFPSNFDADYGYALGWNAAWLVAAGLTSYMSSLRGLVRPSAEWSAGGVPLTSMMNLERRHGHEKPVIRKALVDLEGAPFRAFAGAREAWATSDAYLFPGPIQYWGPSEIVDARTETLRLEHTGG